MPDHFLQIKHLDGELKLYHKNNGLGMTVSTRELVLQRPHFNYRLLLEDIVSVVPYEKKTRPVKSHANAWNAPHGQNIVHAWGLGQHKHYKLDVKRAEIHSRSGILQTGRMQFVMPIHPRLLQAIAIYGGLDGIE